MPVVMGSANYPDDAFDTIRKQCKNVIVIDALHKAQGVGNVKTVNLILLGLLSNYLNIEKELWLEVIRETVPAKFLEVNLAAFQAGREN
jgi:indolepyruvate ferredoxin oxidoreductase beta subunit